MLADFLYGLLIVVTVLAVFGTFRMARSLRRSSDVPSERLLVMTLVILGLLIVLFFFFDSQLDDYRTSKGEVIKTTQQLFVEKIYPPLAEAQSLLNYQLQQLTMLQKRIYELSRDHPQQSARLKLAYNAWKHERQGLTQLKSRADRAVRVAMGLYRVSDKTFVESEFNREAVDWEKIISDRLNKFHDSQLKVTNAMLDNVMLQNKNLNTVLRNKGVLTTVDGGVIKSEFDSRTIIPLLEYLEKTEPDLAETLVNIGKEASNATQKRQEVRNYSLEHPDLQPVLSKVIDGWLQLANKGVYYRDQLLHAVQAEYLAVLLGTNKKDNQILRLKKSISTQSQALHEELEKSRISLGKSYKTVPR